MHALGRLQVLTERQCPQDELLPSQKSVAAGVACGECHQREYRHRTNRGVSVSNGDGGMCHRHGVRPVWAAGRSGARVR